MTQESKDAIYIQRAIELAASAATKDEVPVGAVIVHENRIVAEAHNEKELARSSLYHAELLAIQRASEHLNRWRLTDCTLYVTLEPCIMCAGAIVAARLDRLVFACEDPKAGAVVSLYNILQDSRLNHRPLVSFGICADTCRQQLRAFFLRRRKKFLA
jgi:tRNA(adenine34) deaminase